MTIIDVMLSMKQDKRSLLQRYIFTKVNFDEYKDFVDHLNRNNGNNGTSFWHNISHILFD